MTADNEQIIGRPYKIAEDKDLEGWVAAFTEDGTFTDESIGVTYRGPDELPKTVEIYAREEFMIRDNVERLGEHVTATLLSRVTP